VRTAAANKEGDNYVSSYEQQASLLNIRILLCNLSCTS
jgi:hypothetical protein